MSRYEKYAKKAAAKIKQYGSPITVKRSGRKVYDKATNTYTDTGAEFGGYAIQRSFDQKNIDGTNIKFGDILLMCSLNGTPRSNDTVTYGGRSYTVVNVEPLSPDGNVAVYYKVQAR